MTITRMLGLRQLLAKPAPRARLLDCGWCYEENGEEVHPHPECPIGQPDHTSDTTLALSEANGRLARTTARLEQIAAELEARHVRYAWTEKLAADLHAIAHDTPPMGG